MNLCSREINRKKGNQEQKYYIYGISCRQKWKAQSGNFMLPCCSHVQQNHQTLTSARLRTALALLYTPSQGGVLLL